MSTEIATILTNAAALAQTGLDEDTAAVAGSIGNKRISIAGGTFRMMVNGKEQAAIEDRHMNVVFVKMGHDPSRTWYAKAYKEGEKASPTCWSSDGKTPDAEVKTPQASSCEGCKWSAKGSSHSGSGAACRLSWRTAVVLPNNPDGDVMQLVLPATSCFGKEESGKYPFRPYIQMLANNNISAGRVVTKMQFDTKSPVPKLLFSPVGVVPPEDVEKIQVQKTSPAAEAAIKMTVYQTDEEVSSKEVTEEAPKLRESPSKSEEVQSSSAADVVKKWAKK